MSSSNFSRRPDSPNLLALCIMKKAVSVLIDTPPFPLDSEKVAIQHVLNCKCILSPRGCMTLKMAALDIKEVGFMQPLWQKFARLSIPTFNLEFPPQSTPRLRPSALCFIVCSHSAHPGIKISPRRFITLHTALSKHSLARVDRMGDY